MRLAFALLLIGAAFGTPILHAQNPSSNPILHQVDEHYNHLASLRTRYTERYTGPGIDRIETGTLLLKKPGRMRWIYDKPAGKLFLLDGKYGWSYTPGDAQATRIAAKRLDDLRSPLRFLLGHTQLSKELESLSVSSHLPSPERTPEFQISGVPKGMAQRVKRLMLIVRSSGTIREIRLEELDGAVTDFAFTEVEENVPVRDSDFLFKPPAGVSVIDGLPPI